MTTLDLEKAKKSRAFLVGIITGESPGDLAAKILKYKPEIQQAIAISLDAWLELRDIGYDRVKSMQEFLETRGYQPVLIYPNTALKTTRGELEIASGNINNVAEPKDAIEQAIRTFQTYETLAPWLNRIEEYRTVQGLSKILEGRK